MPKALVRAVSLLLIICLVSDPVAAGIASPPGSAPAMPQISVLTLQAIVPPQSTAHKILPSHQALIGALAIGLISIFDVAHATDPNRPAKPAITPLALSAARGQWSLEDIATEVGYFLLVMGGGILLWSLIHRYVHDVLLTHPWAGSAELNRQQLAEIEALLRDKTFSRAMAERLHQAYYQAQGQTPPVFLSQTEELAEVSDLTKQDETIATSVAGFYAVESAVGLLSERTGRPPRQVLTAIAQGQISEDQEALMVCFAHAAWMAGQPFRDRDLDRITRPAFRLMSHLSEVDRQQAFNQIRVAAAVLLDEIPDHLNRDAQLTRLESLLKSKAFSVRISQILNKAYYANRQEAIPPSAMTGAPVSRRVRDLKLAYNLAGFYALALGLEYLAGIKGVPPFNLLKEIATGNGVHFSRSDELLLARFANVTWKPGQPFRPPDRISRFAFRPAALLSDEELQKDFVQIRAAAKFLWDHLGQTSDKSRRSHSIDSDKPGTVAANEGLTTVLRFFPKTLGVGIAVALAANLLQLPYTLGLMVTFGIMSWVFWGEQRSIGARLVQQAA